MSMVEYKTCNALESIKGIENHKTCFAMFPFVKSLDNFLILDKSLHLSLHSNILTYYDNFVNINLQKRLTYII